MHGTPFLYCDFFYSYFIVGLKFKGTRIELEKKQNAITPVNKIKKITLALLAIHSVLIPSDFLN
jgi:hypothetical protein